MIIYRVLAIMMIVAILFWVGSKKKEASYKVLYRTDVLSFEFFVENCEVNEVHMRYIEGHLREERARDEMEDPAFCNKIAEIAETFEIRFKDLITLERNGEGTSKIC